ncbi:MAG: HlyD family type I secretion periplasmic adaptor subunit [Pseudomonadales bacterium]|nr:HlyD family type I secretion periplasmic adaptor subunit [Pseudomonadales bacterium]
MVETHQEPHAFSPHLLSVTENPPAPLARIVLLLLLLLFFLIILWAFFGRLDIVARADGKLIPISRVQVVQPLDGGRIAEIKVKDGQLVKAGEVLVVMDDLVSQADTAQITFEKKTMDLQLRRVVAEIEQAGMTLKAEDDATLFSDSRRQYQENVNLHNINMSQQRAIIEQEKQSLASEKQILSKLVDTLPLVLSSEAAVKNLQKKGFANQMALMERERERIEIERDLAAQQFRVQSLKARLESAKQQSKQVSTSYIQNLLDQKIEFEQRRKQLAQALSKLEYRNRLLSLTAPQDGFVKDLATHTRGSVIPSGTILLTIVPVDVPLQAEVMIENKDVGFINTGQEVRLKIASFNFQKYGMIEATVDHVSADSGQQESDGNQASASVYRAILNLGEQTLHYNNKEFDLKVGMQVTAEIHLGSRTVMQYIFSPITRAVNEAGTER